MLKMKTLQHTIKYFGFPFLCAIHKYIKMLMTGLTCPLCDENLNCVWNRTCFLGEVCMIRKYQNTPFTLHCSKVSISTSSLLVSKEALHFYYRTQVLQYIFLSQNQDCIFMKENVKGVEIVCCEDHQCICNIVVM